MSCSKEEIERKRLAALQKRQNRCGIGSPLKPSFPQNLPCTSFQGSPKPYTPKSVTHSARKAAHPYAKQESNVKSENSPFFGKVVSGTVYLISEERFEVNPSEFCTPLINIFKSIPSKSYDPISKLWNFSVADYQELMTKVSPMSPDVVLGGLPSFVLKALNQPTVDPNSIDLSPIESTLRNKLMPFQEEGVRFGIAKRGRCMIADDMGLGKTFQALAIASFYRHDWPLLIVTTSSMRETWQSKIHELLPSIPLSSVVSLTTGRDTASVADATATAVVTSYKMCVAQLELLRSKKFGVVIIDESHSLKSHKAQCTIALTKLSSKAARVILLSGSPALSRPSELYTQLHVIQPNFFGGYTEFGKRYCAGKLTNFGWDMSGQSHPTELAVVLQRTFLIRRTKDQVLTGLEDKTREAVLLDESLLQFTHTKEQELGQMAEAYKKTKASERHAALLTFFSETSRVKIPAVCKYIRQLLKDTSSTEKFLVFAHHKEMLSALCEVLDEMGVRYICISGATPARARADLVDRFQHTPACRAAVLSITAANAGITLTAATLVLFAELHWNPGILSQAEARAHRIGQAGRVRARYLLARGTADDHIWPMLQNKLNVLNEVGLSKDSFEDARQTRQESQNHITQYLIPSCSKNRNDYDFDISDMNFSEMNVNFNESDNKCVDDGKSFFDDEEGDELLANLDL